MKTKLKILRAIEMKNLPGSLTEGDLLKNLFGYTVWLKDVEYWAEDKNGYPGEVKRFRKMLRDGEVTEDRVREVQGDLNRLRHLLRLMRRNNIDVVFIDTEKDGD